MATNNFLNMFGDSARVGALLALPRLVLRLTAERIIPARRRAHARRQRVRAGLRAGVLRALHAVAADAHDLPDHESPASSTCRSRGPALLVCNHLSHVDGLLVGACIQRFVRFMVYRPVLRAADAAPVAVDACTRFRSRPGTGGGGRRRSRARAKELEARSRRLHLRGGRDQPHRQPAAVQARASSASSKGSTCRSSRSTSTASGAASSASSGGDSSGSGRAASRIP